MMNRRKYLADSTSSLRRVLHSGMLLGTAAAAMSGILLASCSKNDVNVSNESETEAMNFSVSAQGGWNPGVMTRGVPVKTGSFHDSFGVFAGVFPSDEAWTAASDFSNYMNRVEVKKQTGTLYNTDDPYYLPGKGKSLKFFAWAPYSHDSVRHYEEDGYVAFVVFTDANAESHVDFCLAQSDIVPGDGDGEVELNFKHVMTAVKFVTASVPDEGVIRRVSLTKINCAAPVGISRDGKGNVEWFGKLVNPTPGTKPETGDKDMYADVNFTLDGTNGKSITADNQTFMLIPESAYSGAAGTEKSEIQILYDPDGVENNGDEKTLSADVGEELLPGHRQENMGKMITYHVSIKDGGTLTLVATISDWNDGGSIDVSYGDAMKGSLKPDDASQDYPVIDADGISSASEKAYAVAYGNTGNELGFKFIMYTPAGARWNAGLSNGLDFELTGETSGHGYGDGANTWSEFKVVPTGHLNSDAPQETELYITFTDINGKPHGEQVINSESSMPGTPARIKIRQVSLAQWQKLRNPSEEE